MNDGTQMPTATQIYSSVQDQKWEHIYDPELPYGNVTNKLN